MVKNKEKRKILGGGFEFYKKPLLLFLKTYARIIGGEFETFLT